MNMQINRNYNVILNINLKVGHFQIIHEKLVTYECNFSDTT